MHKCYADINQYYFLIFPFTFDIFKGDPQKSLRKNSIIQNSMLHFALEIQINQGWQFLDATAIASLVNNIPELLINLSPAYFLGLTLYYCQNAIEKKIISTYLFSHMFCLYSMLTANMVKYFPRDFWRSPLEQDSQKVTFGFCCTEII